MATSKLTWPHLYKSLRKRWPDMVSKIEAVSRSNCSNSFRWPGLGGRSPTWATHGAMHLADRCGHLRAPPLTMSPILGALWYPFTLSPFDFVETRPCFVLGTMGRRRAPPGGPYAVRSREVFIPEDFITADEGSLILGGVG